MRYNTQICTVEVVRDCSDAPPIKTKLVAETYNFEPERCLAIAKVFILTGLKQFEFISSLNIKYI